MRTRFPSSFAKILVICCFVALAANAFAVNGAIYTTTAGGTTVNGNIYLNKGDVYLSGGPQNKSANGLADGLYYFQVTDPSGATLLSLDDIRCRLVQVSGGVLAGVPSDDGTAEGSPGAGTPGCYHNTGGPDVSNGAVTVQLCSASGCPSGPPPGNPPAALSYYDTPNPGGEYKAWMIPVGSYSPTGTDNCSKPNSHIDFGFCDSDSKTDNFKVKPPNQATITACKFIDQDGDSTFDPNATPLPDFLFAGWPITAKGVDGDTGSGVLQYTGQDGCATFTYTFTSGGPATDTVILNEDLSMEPGYTQVAPPDGQCVLTGSVVNASDTCSVTGGVITVTISNNDIVVAPFFGNALPSNSPPPMQVSKTASGGDNFTWGVSKSVDKTEIDDSTTDGKTGTATFNYTVTVTHDGGTGWVVGGAITLVNPASTDQNINSLTDTTGVVGENCTIPDFVSGMIIPANGSPVSLNYTCTFPTNPGPGTNTATADSLTPATAAFDFTAADTSAKITDSIAVDLGTVTINADTTSSCPAAAPADFVGSNWKCAVAADNSTVTFTYSEAFTDTAGQCTSHNNTATFTTNTNGTGSSSQVTATQCVGEDLTVAKTATANFTAGLSKSVNQTQVEQAGGNITFNYTVNLTSPTFSVGGTITVSNPNNWESITASVGDTIDSGGACTVYSDAGLTKSVTSVTVTAGGSVPLYYNCTYSTNPTKVSGTNTASVSNESATNTEVGTPNYGKAGSVPGTPSPGTAAYTFPTLTITDNVQDSANPSGCTATLGTVTATTTTASTTPGCGVSNLKSPSWGKFTYSITDSNANPGTCTSYNNTAQITGGSGSNQVTVTVCNTSTGALTMGFWQNKNGQGIITGGAYTGTGKVCNSGTWLRQFNPFQSLSTTATCSQVASYVSSVIGAATCSSSTGTCNAMLKAQMLATALDVYFSDPTLGGNKIGAFNNLGGKTPAIGGLAIDLSKICDGGDGGFGGSCPEDARRVFGICTAKNTPVAGCSAGVLGTTVLNMLLYSDFASSINGNPVAVPNTGATWYLQTKGLQVVAKDAFDSINNQKAPIAASGVGTPSF